MFSIWKLSYKNFLVKAIDHSSIVRAYIRVVRLYPNFLVSIAWSIQEYADMMKVDVTPSHPHSTTITTTAFCN